MAEDTKQNTNPNTQAPNDALGSLSHRSGGKEMESTGVEDWKSVGEANIEVVNDNPEIEPEPELEGYIQKVEKAPELDIPIIDDYTGQVLLNPVRQSQKIPELPMTEEQVVEGLHHQVFDSIRWLAEWCVRQIKVLHGRVRYKS